jgi:glycosyltransferase involved in cell wall biosynthesis
MDSMHALSGERRSLLRAVESFAPQVIHGQSHGVARPLGLLGRRTGLPLLLTVHWRPQNVRAFRRLAPRLAGVIATTQDVREEMVNDCGVDRLRIRVIHNGVDVSGLFAREVPPILRSAVPVVGSLGPVEQMRGHEFFVRAAALLVSRGVAAQFLVAGEGAELPDVRRLVASLGLERHVTLVTGFSTYADILDAIDVVVQNSLVDVSGFSMLEAMAHGRPVVSFSTGTACETIEDHRTGLLVPKGDVKALAEAIRQLLADADTARQMGEDARKSVAEKFDIRAIAGQTLQYYSDALTGWAEAQKP